jgi:DUF4097 and DUF4098 domain-containing protein YvlB
MKRSSLIGPLILIGLGVVFLLRNLRPELPILDFLSQAWPFLLIAWGVLRLGELFYWKMREQVLPESGISGGEWTLIVVLCLFGSGLFFFRQQDSWWNGARMQIGGIDMFGETFEFPVSGQAKTAKAPRVVIESFRGDAQILGTDGDEVKVTGRKSVRAINQSDADRADRDTPLEVVVQGDTVIIRTNQERVNSKNRVTSRLDILVPKGASVDARGRYGDFDIRDLNGPVEISSDNAGVRIENVTQAVKIDTRRSDIIRLINVTGNVELRGGGTDVELEKIKGQVSIDAGYSGTVQMRELAKPVRYSGREMEFRAEAVPGEVRSSLGTFRGDHLAGPVLVTSPRKTKDVQLSNFTVSAEVNVNRGDVELRPAKLPLGKIDVNTKNGEITLWLPDQAKFDLRASTKRGEVENDFGPVLKAEPDGRGWSLKGAVGNGPTVSLQTDRGQISVHKGTGSSADWRDTPDKAPVTPPPPPPVKAPPQPAPVVSQ